MVQNVNFAPVERLVMEQQVKVVFYVFRSLLLARFQSRGLLVLSTDNPIPFG